MNNQNTYISTFYTPGYSSIKLSLYKTGLVIAFTPWVQKNNPMGGEYDSKQFLSVTIDYEKAYALLNIVKLIINEKDGCPFKVTLPCNNDASLTFEHMVHEDRQLRSFLIIDKNGSKITYLFNITQYSETVNGQEITNTSHSGLCVFARSLNSYLSHISPIQHTSKLDGTELGSPYAQLM